MPVAVLDTNAISDLMRDHPQVTLFRPFLAARVAGTVISGYHV